METPPVESGEMVYRQVGPGGNPVYFASGRKPPVHWSLFLPGRQDDDGLSLIRRRFRTPIWAAFRPDTPETRFRLICMDVALMQDVAQLAGLPEIGFEPTPDGLDQQHGPPWAHCAAREINRGEYDSNRQIKVRIKQWARDLADRIEHEQIIGPFDAPGSDDSYRPAAAL